MTADVFDTLLCAALPALRVYALHLTHEDDAAADLVQDAIVLMLTNRTRFDGVSFKAWARSIVHNRFISDRRKAKYRQCIDIAAVPERLLGIEGTVEVRDEVRSTLRAVRELPRQQKATLHLVVFEGLSHRDASTRLGVREGTSKSDLSRARARLAAA